MMVPGLLSLPTFAARFSSSHFIFTLIDISRSAADLVVTSRKGYIPGLDGIRALAIGLVLFCHCVIFDDSNPLRQVGLGAGYAGVALFFVLSGYLITTLLVREEDRTGGISLRLFYIRRAMRLLPALWIYLLVVGTIWLAGGFPDDPWHDYVSSLLYVRNLVGRGHVTGQLWSLSVEGQFYLLWPLVLLALPRRNLARLVFGVVAIVGITAWRSYAARAGLASSGMLYTRSDFRFDAPLFGCVLALAIRVAPEAFHWLTSTGPRSSALAIQGVAGLSLWVGLRLDQAMYPGTGDAVVCLLAVSLILSQIGVQGRGSRWLACRPMAAIGRVSYGVYLWQGLFLGPRDPGFHIIRSFPVNLMASFAVALLSYRFLELPFLRSKARGFHKAAG